MAAGRRSSAARDVVVADGEQRVAVARGDRKEAQRVVQHVGRVVDGGRDNRLDAAGSS